MQKLDAFNLVWNSPSVDSSGSMPIGNGELGLNVWTEKNGDILFYAGRTDSWSECGRLLKLGRVRISLTPNPIQEKEGTFSQILNLHNGLIEIKMGVGDKTLKVLLFVDPDAPQIRIAAEGSFPFELSASLETWRNCRHVLKDELVSCWTMYNSKIEVAEESDVFSEKFEDLICAYHRNTHSVYDFTIERQALGKFKSKYPDPLINRNFGMMAGGKGLKRISQNTIKSSSPSSSCEIVITTHCEQSESADAWLDSIKNIHDTAPSMKNSLSACKKWWNDYWNRSWIFVEGDPAESGYSESPLTRSYILQRWVTACAGRGHYPIKFNGSLFTVDPVFTNPALAVNVSADYRRWGDCYWYQNSRLPYLPMPARGDFDMMMPFFKMYMDMLGICSERVKVYHNCEGAYFPETVTFYGLYSNFDYGWAPKSKPDENLQPYWQWAWNQGPELVMLMLDYYDYTADEKFFNDMLIPMAYAVLKYFDTRFGRDEEGRLRISPDQSLETYWKNVVNDTPCIAGLHAVLKRILALPEEKIAAEIFVSWKKLYSILPPLPVKEKDGVRIIDIAQSYTDERSNCENPEIYPIFPFRLFGVGKADLELARETYRQRPVKDFNGWHQGAMVAALCGLTEEAQNAILSNIQNYHKKFRFPANWGPNFDWLPDQDHGSNIMAAVQLMLMQCDDGKIYLLPAWPRNWDVSFKLHAPGNTTVELVYQKGKVIFLKVFPESQIKNVVVCIK